MADALTAAPSVFVNADVTTLDPAHPRANGIAVAGGKIERLLDAVPTGLPNEVRVFDCRGMAIVPGFHDCHMHLTDTGLLAGPYDLAACKTIEDILQRLAGLPDAVLFAGNYEDEHIVERRPPRLAELDAIAPDRPVLIARVDGHSCVVNSAGLAFAGVDHLAGVERDALGAPTGRLSGPANYAAQAEFQRRLPDKAKRAADARAARMALREGITTLHNVIAWDPAVETLEQQYRADAALPLRVVSKACTTSVAKAKQLGGRVFGGDIFVDGSIGSKTAAVHGQYCGGGGGLLYLHAAELGELFDEAAESGLSLGVHAIGGRAIEEALAAWESVIARRGPLHGVRPSIDHFEIATRDQIERAARCGMLLSMQPAFDYLWGGESGMYAERLGAERALEMNLFKTAAGAGCTLCAGSDSPVTKLSALLGIHSLVNHHVESERMPVDAALRAYCSDAAKLSFDEQRRGTLAPGMDADFAILAHALDRVPPSGIKDVTVMATVVNGEVRYAAEGGGL